MVKLPGTYSIKLCLKLILISIKIYGSRYRPTTAPFNWLRFPLWFINLKMEIVPTGSPFTLQYMQ